MLNWLHARSMSVAGGFARWMTTKRSEGHRSKGHLVIKTVLLDPREHRFHVLGLYCVNCELGWPL